MNTLPRQAMIIAMVFFTFTSARSLAQDAAKARNLPDVGKLREQSKPGPEHDHLAKHVGVWKATVTKGDGVRAVSSTGRVKTHMMMDGRFLWIAYNVAGRGGTFKGAFMIGFDRRNNCYTLVGIDTHGTYSVASQGKPDPKTQTIRLYGKDDDPNMKAMGFDKEFVHVLDFRNPNEFAIDVHYVDTRTPERREMKAMAFVFTRDR